MEELCGPDRQDLGARARALIEVRSAVSGDDHPVQTLSAPPFPRPIAPIALHIDLYRYWNAKRGARVMPLRRDIDPVEIPHLLAHIAIVDRPDGIYRWRLMGSALVDDFGRDFTGKNVGAYFGPSPFVDAVLATFDRVLSGSGPIFEENIYKTTYGVSHPVSRLLLPLNNEQGEPEMILLTRIMRSGFALLLREQDRLKGACGGVQGTFEILTVEDLQARAVDWARRAGAFSQTVSRDSGQASA